MVLAVNQVHTIPFITYMPDCCIRVILMFIRVISIDLYNSLLGKAFTASSELTSLVFQSGQLKANLTCMESSRAPYSLCFFTYRLGCRLFLFKTLCSRMTNVDTKNMHFWK